MNEFKFNASEYAKLLGISTSAIRKRRLSGKLDGQFEKRNSEYFYKTPPKDRPNKGAVTPYNFKQFTSGDRRSQFRQKNTLAIIPDPVAEVGMYRMMKLSIRMLQTDISCSSLTI